MAIEKDRYSLWISTRPYSKELPLTDDDFMFIGSSSSLPVSMSYSSSTTGILGQTPDTAIFVDGVGGAVMNISISAQRVNPVTYKDDITVASLPSSPLIGDMYRIWPPTGTMLTINGKKYAKGRLIAWNGSSWINVDTWPPLYSNRYFIEKLTAMRTRIQMMDNAYVLRVYNITQVSETIKKSSLSNLSSFRDEGCGINAVPKELYVFLNDFDISLSMDAPNEVGVTLNLVQRNQLKGYNE